MYEAHLEVDRRMYAKVMFHVRAFELLVITTIVLA